MYDTIDAWRYTRYYTFTRERNTMNSSKKKYALWALIVIVVVALGTAIYMYWYVPRTPVYTLNIIRTAVDNHDANTIFKHIDTKSIVGKTVDREIEKSTGSDKDDVKHFAPLIKTVAVAAVNNLIIDRVQNADTNSANGENNISAVNGESSKSAATQKKSADAGDIVQDILDGNIIKSKNVALKDISSDIDNEDTATITVKLENTTTKEVVNLQLLAKQLDDGTWRIFDIPNLTELKALE